MMSPVVGVPAAAIASVVPHKAPSTDKVSIHELQLRCEIGFNPHEIGKLQQLLVTVHVETDMSLVVGTDDIEKGVDLKSLSKAILEAIEGKTYKLIESVADDIARIALSLSAATAVEVQLFKPGALRFSTSSSCSLHRQKGDYKPFSVLVAGGSNIEPETNIPKALELLKKMGDVSAVSQLYVTPPVGEGAGGEFVNFAVELHTPLLHSSGMLKSALRKIESKLGRVRDPSNKNAPRPMDLDAAVIRNGCVRHDYCDPDIARFAHVAVPLADLAPGHVFAYPKGAVVKASAVVKTDEKVSILEVARRLTKNEPATFFPVANIKLDRVAAKLTEAESESPNGKRRLEENPGSGAPVAIVTGGASKLGRYISTALHNSGYRVLIHCSASMDASRTLAEELNGKRPASAAVVQADLSMDPQSAAQAITKEAVALWGRIDAVINNASTFKKQKVMETSSDDWTQCMNTNAAAPMFLTLASLPELERNKGSVVNMCDIHGERPLIGHALYSITKATIIAETKALAKDSWLPAAAAAAGAGAG